MKISHLKKGMEFGFLFPYFKSYKNILITFYAAKLMIDGEITLGTMLVIQFIIGQVNMPIIRSGKVKIGQRVNN